MLRLQAFKFELMPNGEQGRNMRRFAGACRFVFNKALAMQLDNHQAGNQFIGYVAMAKLLTGWRNGSDTPWQKDAPCHPLQHALKDLERATQQEFEQPMPAVTTAIGIDVGIARFATMRDASFIAPLNSFKKHQQRVARYQRRMSRTVKFSHHWKKARARVQKLHTRIANARRDFLHKTSTAISKNHPLVFIEDLQVGNMPRSAKGTVDQPGQKVRQKSGLNRAILDQGWGELRRQLDYKVAWNGGMLLAVPPHHTSQTCPCCGHASKDNRQTRATLLCAECGDENHADVVGAINVLAPGHRVLAYGEFGAFGPLDEA